MQDKPQVKKSIEERVLEYLEARPDEVYLYRDSALAKKLGIKVSSLNFALGLLHWRGRIGKGRAPDGRRVYFGSHAAIKRHSLVPIDKQEPAKTVGREASQDSPKIFASYDIANPPPRVEAFNLRIVRDTELTRALKERYGYACQVCGLVLKTGGGGRYAEAHHLRPLGRDHRGLDRPDNILILCPNHHAEFDYGTIAIDSSDCLGLLHKFVNKISGKKLRFEAGHRIAHENVDYHYRRIFNTPLNMEHGTGGALKRRMPGAK